MKARLKDNYIIDANHTLLAGAEVEITNGWCGCDGYYYGCILPDDEQMYVGGNEFAGSQHVINDNILEIIDYEPYINWEQRRYEIAKAVMAANYASPELMQFLTKEEAFPFDELARVSVKAVDALIKELRK